MTNYGHFTVLQGYESFDGNVERFFGGQINGWVGAGVEGTLHVQLARWSGGSGIRIELWEDEPPQSNWEDIVEVSATFSADEPVGWQTWDGTSMGDLALAAGTYRVRVSARGRDAGHADEFADGVVDRYLMQFWLADDAPDKVLQTQSRDAAYWNRDNGGRPEWFGKVSQQPDQQDLNAALREANLRDAVESLGRKGSDKP